MCGYKVILCPTLEIKLPAEVTLWWCFYRHKGLRKGLCNCSEEATLDRHCSALGRNADIMLGIFPCTNDPVCFKVLHILQVSCMPGEVKCSILLVYFVKGLSSLLACSYWALCCRTQLAGMHHNENAQRKQAEDSKGQLSFWRRLLKAKKGHEVVCPMKVKATYGKLILFKRVADLRGG